MTRDGFELVVPDLSGAFFYTAPEPGAANSPGGPQPVLTTGNGRFTVGRARLAPAMISTPVTGPPEGANARPCQPGAMLPRSSFDLHGQIRPQSPSVRCNAAPNESGSAGCNI